MATVADGTDRGLKIGRRRTVRCAAVLCAAAIAAIAATGDGHVGPRAVMARPGAAAAEPSILRAVAHAGGRFNGLVVEGDTVYIGEGADVVALRVEADAALVVVHRTTLPSPVTSLAIAPEVDRLYAATGDSVHAIDIADGQPPTVVGEIAVPLESGTNIAARGDVVYGMIRWAGPTAARCIVALRFGGPPSRGTVGPSVCATDVPADAFEWGDQLTLGDDVLAVYRVHAFGAGVPDVSLFDVRAPDRPRFARSITLETPIVEADMAGHRLWVVTRAGRVIQSFDVADMDAAPKVIFRRADAYVEHMFLAVGEVWLSDGGSQYRAYDPDATDLSTSTKDRTVMGCLGSPPPDAWIAATRDVLLVLHSGQLVVCRIPPDDAHITEEEASWRYGDGPARLVAAADGQAFAAGYGMAQYRFGSPAGLVRTGGVLIRGRQAELDIDAFDADARHLVALQGEQVAALRLPIGDDYPTPDLWTIPATFDGTFPVTRAVHVTGDRAVVLRGNTLDAVDLAQPDRPAGRISNRWRLGRALAAGPEWVAVLAGGAVSDAGASEWVAPHIVLVDVRSSPPSAQGELTLTDRVGWRPVGIARVGDRLAVALTQRTGGTPSEPLRDVSEVVVVDATTAATPTVVGRVAIEGETNVEATAIAAVGSLAIVGGTRQPGRGPDPEPGWSPLQPEGRLWVVDFAEPERPLVRASQAVPGRPFDIAIDGRAVLVAAGDGGLQRFDLVLPGDVPAPIWRLSLPWLASGERFVRGQPIPVRATARPMPTTAP